MYGVYSDYGNPAKLDFGKGTADLLEVFWGNSLADSPKSKMGREGLRFFFVTKAGGALFDLFLQGE